MTTLSFTSTGEIDIQPSATSSKNDFDFFEGQWNVHNKKLKSRLNNCIEWIEFDAVQEMRKVLSGIGNVDNMKTNVDGNNFEGMSLRLFDPAKKLWSIYWADNNAGVLDKPVVGSFDKNSGNFFCKDKYHEQDIIMQFHWDIADKNAPVWSQAFSIDNGKTWEWNWYMYFSKVDKVNKVDDLNRDQQLEVIELRNYIIKNGQRDRFIDYYEQNLMLPQNELNGFTLGQYKIKYAENNFFFIRGFHNMDSRNKFLNDFYLGPSWKQHRNLVNPMIVNNDHVHLLKPLPINNPGNTVEAFNSNWFGKKKGIAVIDYFIANQKRDKLIDFMQTTYISNLKNAGIKDISFWISESSPNEFTTLPVFQDKNLLVSIHFYKDELEYQSKLKRAEANLTEAQMNKMLDIITIKNTLILYSTEGCFHYE
ncbi:MAG: NIPSNAP family protein [Ferruginibacter sp.]